MHVQQPKIQCYAISLTIDIGVTGIGKECDLGDKEVFFCSLEDGDKHPRLSSVSPYGDDKTGQMSLAFKSDRYHRGRFPHGHIPG